MKNILLLAILILGSFQTVNSQNKAEMIFKNNILIVEVYLKGEETKIDELKSSAEFLQRLSGIKYYINFESYELSEVTSKQNLKDWKEWFRKNNRRLYWDENEKDVKIK